MCDYTLYIQKSLKILWLCSFTGCSPFGCIYLSSLEIQGLEKLNRELKEEEEEQLPVDISLFPDSIFKGFQVSVKCFVSKT